ncbi:MAG: SUF system NifU family Fe-S cluster assembly protein [Phycisphaerae bacterium]|nr:SUF system NifU family Fe-S cluster assembly protein [Phycisphaerae bacterium]
MNMTDELYQEVILDHNRHARNYHAMTDATHTAEGYNPLCGDHYQVHLKLNDQGVIESLAFEGEGCAISKASLSIMTDALKGKTADEAKALFEAFHDLVTGQAPSKDSDKSLGKLAVFGGVCKFPSRIKCATLGWHALMGALNQSQGRVSTE